ncbi:MAG TPA: ATP-binding protein [Candidatus Methylomirabilis sp.]|nr:ATP-binding protein [Candidatus Methylomirabilis sp.]
MRFGIAAKSVLPIAALVAFSLAMAGVYLDRQQRVALVAQTVALLEAEAALLSPEVGAAVSEGDAWARRAAARVKSRVTVIASEGRVLADSDESSERMENHAGRPEVAQALASGSGHSLRFSQTVNRDLLYFAQSLPQPDGGRLILRLAVPVRELGQGFSRFRRDFLVAAGISLALTAGLAYLWARRITQPLRRILDFARALSRGEMGHRLPVRPGDELGELSGALNAMAADLRSTLQRLEEEGRRIRAIMESMAEGLLVIDGRGRISLVNSAAETMLGLKRDAALGQTPLEAVRSHELDELLKAAARQEGGASVEITLAYPRRRILAGAAVAIRDAGGAIQGTVLVFRDITQLKRLEEARMEFVVNVSHELRTPITAIRGYAETLLEDGLKNQDEARKFLEIIHRNAERLGRLLNDLLDLSNIELDRTPLSIRPLGVAEAVRQTVAMLAPQAERKAVRLATEVPDVLPPVLADRDRLLQILVNLIDNAVKYTPEGGSVIIRAAVLPLEGAAVIEQQPSSTPALQQVEITVEDTGIGIPAKDLPRITERFYRVDKARSRDLGGTGLGLAIVKHLVQAHHGSLTIESEPGKGTRVRVILPSVTVVHSAA